MLCPIRQPASIAQMIDKHTTEFQSIPRRAPQCDPSWSSRSRAARKPARVVVGIPRAVRRLRLRDGVRIIKLLHDKPSTEAAVELLFRFGFPLWVAGVAYQGIRGVRGYAALFDSSATGWLGMPLSAAGVVLFAWALGVDHKAPGARTGAMFGYFGRTAART